MLVHLRVRRMKVGERKHGRPKRRAALKETWGWLECVRMTLMIGRGGGKWPYLNVGRARRRRSVGSFARIDFGLGETCMDALHLKTFHRSFWSHLCASFVKNATHCRNRILVLSCVIHSFQAFRNFNVHSSHDKWVHFLCHWVNIVTF